MSDLYIADAQNCRVRAVNVASGVINTVAGNGTCEFTGDGAATQNAVYYPGGVTADISDNLFIAGTYDNMLRWVDTTGQMTIFPGNGTAGYGGDGGAANSAELDGPVGIAQDSAGNFLVADQNNLRIRGITALSA